MEAQIETYIDLDDTLYDYYVFDPDYKMGFIQTRRIKSTPLPTFNEDW